MKGKYFSTQPPADAGWQFNSDEFQDWLERYESENNCEFRGVLSSAVIFKRLDT